MARDPRIDRGLLAQLTERRRRVEAGERSLGWKLGFGTEAAMRSLGTSEPLVGYLLESGRLKDGGECDLSGWANPRLEPEIAVYVGSDLAIAGIGAAIELVDLDPDETDPEAILAGDIFTRHVVLGPRHEGASAAGISARITHNGEDVASAEDASEATGDPAGLVRHVGTTLAAAGERLQGGDVIICGSVVPALVVAPGDEVEVALDPLGSVSVRFRA